MQDVQIFYQKVTSEGIVKFKPHWQTFVYKKTFSYEKAAYKV